MSDRLVRLLHAAYAAPDAGASDADLLARVADGKDDAAFELLVRRHADIVWRVCRQVARDHHTAEDAFQAAFLALARRAGAVREVAGFLHRVAFHAALKAKPRPAAPLSADPPSPSPSPDRMAELSELGPLLHAELNRLPDRYRVAVVLCHLEGYTQAEAAARLGCPVGTVATWVRRGCDRLRDRLTRRGVGLPTIGVFLAGADAGAVPRALIRLTAGVGAGNPAVARLATGALVAMRVAQVKMLLIPAAAVAMAVGGVAWSAGQTPGPKPTAEPTKPAAAPVAEKKPEPKYADYFDRQKSMDTLKRVGLAFHNFHDAKDRLPADIASPDGKPLLSWRVELLPYLDQELLHGMFKLDEPWDSPHNATLLKHMPKVYADDPIPTDGRTRVERFAGPGTMFEPGKALKFQDIEDGLSNTLMAVAAGPLVPWTKPDDIQFDPAKPLPPLAGPFADGFPMLYGDGSVRWQAPDADPEFLRRIVERSDGQAVVEPPARPGPARPLTDREMRYLKVARGNFALQRDHAERLDLELERLRAEVRKGGPLPRADVPAGDDLEGTLRAWNQVGDLVRGRSAEAYRLWQVLEQRDPQAAARLRKELEPTPPADKK